MVIFIESIIFADVLGYIYEKFAPITKIINMSIDSGIFPNRLKEAQVTPIFKKNDPFLKSKYRPVSILPIPSKNFEKVLSIHTLTIYILKYHVANSRMPSTNPLKLILYTHYNLKSASNLLKYSLLYTMLSRCYCINFTTNPTSMSLTHDWIKYSSCYFILNRSQVHSEMVGMKAMLTRNA
jgi:hypothetical protein